MSILIVEDQVQDVEGILAKCEARGWQTQVCRTFYDAAVKLADQAAQYTFVLLDIILPWGPEVPESIAHVYSYRIAGLYLLEAMRECGKGNSIMKELEIPEFRGRHIHTPVVVLSKIDSVEDDCRKLDILNFYGKVVYPFDDIIGLMEGYVQPG